MATRGVILFAHGARDPGWSEPIEALRDRFAALAAAQSGP
jgi:sirohydrochlorin ferrochelatase